MSLLRPIRTFQTGVYAFTRAAAPVFGADGRLSAPTTTTFDTGASVQPVTGDDIKSAPEGYLIENLRLVLSSVEIKVLDCFVADDGQTYSVITAEKWIARRTTHWRCYAAKQGKP